MSKVEFIVSNVWSGEKINVVEYFLTTLKLHF